MTIWTTEMESEVAQTNAARDAELASMNAIRLDAWKGRYPYNAVEVPETREPPKWPAIRSSIGPGTANVTQLKVKRG